LRWLVVTLAHIAFQWSANLGNPEVWGEIRIIEFHRAIVHEPCGLKNGSEVGIG
jgi:hypothetical protein